MRKFRRTIAYLLIGCLFATAGTATPVFAEEVICEPEEMLSGEDTEFLETVPPQDGVDDEVPAGNDGTGDDHQETGDAYSGVDGGKDMPLGEVSDFDLEYEVPLLSQGRRLRKSGTGLPSVYNLYEQKKLSPVRSQGTYGSCWAFSAIGAMETDLIHDTDDTVSSPDFSADPSSPDLSELHLAYYAANTYDDPKGCRTVDVDSNGKNWLDNGGHIVWASRLLSQVVGAVDEETAPYGTGPGFNPDSSYIVSKDTAQVRNAYFINPSDRDEIKKAIMEHYGVCASYKETHGSEYNAAYNSYYFNDTGHNHAVMFVGWDDSFPKENFTKTVNAEGKEEGPEDDGAWLVRNNWGYNDYGHSGYFWMSYEDKGWNSTGEVIAFDVSEDLYDNCYAYDGCYLSSMTYSLSEKNKVVMEFPVTAGEVAKSVAFEIGSANVAAHIEVRNTKTGESTAADIHTTYAGIYTAELDSPLAFPEDADAQVSLVFKADNGEEVKFICEGKINRYGVGKYKIEYTGVCDNGFDCGSKHYNYDPRVRLFTDTGGVRVEGVKVSRSSATVIKGETIKLDKTITPGDASNMSVTWTSSNNGVASVSKDGVVTAVTPGSAVITIKTKDGGWTDTCSVTVKPVPVSSVSLDKTTASVKAGSKLTLLATVLPENAGNKNVTWSSSKTDIATVSSTGVVTGRKVGKTVITVKTKDGGKTAKCTVNVKEVPASKVKLDNTKATIKSGKKLQLSATVKPDNTTDKTVKWSSSKPGLVTVSSKGVVKAVGKSGTATITAKTANGKTATCKITVEPVKVKKVKLNKEDITVKKGKKVTLTAKISPENATNKKVTWKSKNEKIAKVSKNGVVKGLKRGKTTITVTTADGKKTAKCTVTVK